MATKKIIYSEPEDYFPKSIRDQYFGDKKKTTTTKKKTTAGKNTKKSK